MPLTEVISLYLLEPSPLHTHRALTHNQDSQLWKTNPQLQFQLQQIKILVAAAIQAQRHRKKLHKLSRWEQRRGTCTFCLCWIVLTPGGIVGRDGTPVETRATPYAVIESSLGAVDCLHSPAILPGFCLQPVPARCIRNEAGRASSNLALEKWRFHHHPFIFWCAFKFVLFSMCLIIFYTSMHGESKGLSKGKGEVCGVCNQWLQRWPFSFTLRLAAWLKQTLSGGDCLFVLCCLATCYFLPPPCSDSSKKKKTICLWSQSWCSVMSRQGKGRRA